jgi:hypothetical protein
LGSTEDDMIFNDVCGQLNDLRLEEADDDNDADLFYAERNGNTSC